MPGSQREPGYPLMCRFTGRAADCVLIMEIDFDAWTGDVRRRLFELAAVQLRGREHGQANRGREKRLRELKRLTTEELAGHI